MHFIKYLLLSFVFLLIYSCNNEDITEITAIELTTDNQPLEILKGDTFFFRVKANNSTDITVDSRILVDGVEITGNSFITDTTPREYQVQAFYNGLESEIITIYGAEGFRKNVLIEDYTGTWCGYCTRVAYAIQQTELLSEYVVPVAIHMGDDYEFQEGITINNTFGIETYPNARLDRTHTWTDPEPDNVLEAIYRTGLSSLGIAINSSLSGLSIDMTIKVSFEENLTIPLGIVVYLVEDGLHHDQTNYTNYFGGDNLLTDFEHNDVLRAVYTNVLGDVIPGDQTVENSIYNYNVMNTIPDTVENINNVHLVAFVVNLETNEVINVRSSEIGINQDFEN